MCPTLPQRLSIPRIDRKDRWSIEGGKAIIAAAEAAADQAVLETVEEISDPEPSTNAAPMGAGAVEGRPITPTNMSYLVTMRTLEAVEAQAVRSLDNLLYLCDRDGVELLLKDDLQEVLVFAPPNARPPPRAPSSSSPHAATCVWCDVSGA